MICFRRRYPGTELAWALRKEAPTIDFLREPYAD
jgi:hypothetical protein